MTDNYETLYTEPKLRRKLKKKIMAGKKGGRRGTWSARKAQILVKKYESNGGGYRNEKVDSPLSLMDWTAQNWQTIDGSTKAGSKGMMQRHLPTKVWAMLSRQQQQRAEKTKIQKDRFGQQFADWPGFIYSAMTAAGMTSDSPKTVRKKRLKKFASRLGLDVDGSESKGDFIRFIKESGGKAPSSKSGGQTRTAKQPKGSKQSKSNAAKSSQARKDLKSLTKDELYQMAKEQDVPGRSTMNKGELVAALK